MTKLAAKEEAYVRARAAGKGPSDAYRASRDTSRMATATINANAKRLERKPAVKARIEELRRESQESRESSGPAEPSGASGPTPSETELRVKQERFLQLFLEKGNASEAYRQAYDVSPDTAPATIHRCAAELLANPKVTTRLEQLRAELRERSAITLDTLVEALRPLVFGDIRKVCDWGPAIPLKDPETGEVVVVQDVIVKARADLDDAAAAMIAKVIRSKDGSVRVELHDKLAAIERIAKLLGLLKEQHEVKLENVTPPQPKVPPKEVIERWIRNYENAYARFETPETRKADEKREQARQRRLEALASETEEHRKLLVHLGVDEDKARREAESTARLSTFLPEQDAQTRRRKRAEHLRQRFKVGERDGGEAPKLSLWDLRMGAWCEVAVGQRVPGGSQDARNPNQPRCRRGAWTRPMPS